VTIDHVLPQSIAGDWLDDFGDDEVHSQWVHTWPNLILLLMPLNSLKSTSSLGVAKNLVTAENMFASTDQFFASYSSWTVSDLEARAQKLSDFAVQRWPKDAVGV